MNTFCHKKTLLCACFSVKWFSMSTRTRSPATQSNRKKATGKGRAILPDPDTSAMAPTAMKASERLARRIAAKLLKTGFAVGAVLPSESEMAAMYNVGRSTVRESLRVLEGWGIVSVRAGRNGGPMAHPPRTSDLGSHMGVVMQFESTSLLDVFDARMALDCLVARRAAERIDDEELEDLSAALRALSQASADSRQFFKCNLRYYDVVVDACGNRALKVLLKAFRDMTHLMIRELDYPQSWRDIVLDCRRKLFRAIAAGDPDGAEEQMRRYRDETREYWMACYAPMFNRPIDAIGLSGTLPVSTGKASSIRPPAKPRRVQPLRKGRRL